jgi:hypothetical protein
MSSKESTTASRPVYVESVKAAANRLGYSEGLIQWTKDQALPAWRGCRCYVDELQEWFDENGIPELQDDEADKWNLEILKERHRKLKIQNDIEEGKSLDADAVKAFLFELAIRQKNTIKKILEDELPAALAGKPVDEIRAINKGMVDKLCDRMQQEFREWKTQN